MMLEQAAQRVGKDAAAALFPVHKPCFCIVSLRFCHPKEHAHTVLKHLSISYQDCECVVIHSSECTFDMFPPNQTANSQEVALAAEKPVPHVLRPGEAPSLPWEAFPVGKRVRRVMVLWFCWHACDI